jgi:indole-3-glycerol phosphate synthase
MTTPIQTGTYLDRILANTAEELVARKAATPLHELEAQARLMPPALDLTRALRTGQVEVIAEVKRASPSKGEIAPGIVAADVGRDYLAGSAAAISVLTDEKFFRGSLDDLQAVAELAHADAQPRPVLRKDFVIDAYQIVEARAAGADAVLLIVAGLTDGQLAELHAAALAYGLSVLVEIHDEAELQRALKIAPKLLGINNRDLRTFNVDLATTERLAPRIPREITIVGESGIASHADLERLGRSGVHAVLVGELLMRQADRAGALRELREGRCL